MKNTSTKNNSQKRVYGVIGMVALFLMGGIFGFIINGSDRVNNSVMSKHHCDILASRIIDAANHNNPNLLAELNKVFSENCNNRDFRDEPKPVQAQSEVKPEKLPDTTCAAIEKLLKAELADENDLNWQAHRDNADIYTRLVKNGCEKNKEMYQKLAQREQDIAESLRQEITVADDRLTCEEIESVLVERLRCTDKLSKCMDADLHVDDAQIYANLSERGCPENSEKYKALAKQELEIARAITDDSIRYSNEKEDAMKMVETYKRLQMQAEATKMLEKAKKLTNPAIDFIIQLEKIIEE